VRPSCPLLRLPRSFSSPHRSKGKRPQFAILPFLKVNEDTSPLALVNLRPAAPLPASLLASRVLILSFPSRTFAPISFCDRSEGGISDFLFSLLFKPPLESDCDPLSFPQDLPPTQQVRDACFSFSVWKAPGGRGSFVVSVLLLLS